MASEPLHSLSSDLRLSRELADMADAISLDATLLDDASSAFLDEIGEAWDDGTTFLLGLVPSVAPATRPELKELARPAFDLVDRLGFARTTLAERAVPTPTCGLAGASNEWVRRR